jgi:hypothetical protein
MSSPRLQKCGRRWRLHQRESRDQPESGRSHGLCRRSARHRLPEAARSRADRLFTIGDFLASGHAFQIARGCSAGSSVRGLSSVTMAHCRPALRPPRPSCALGGIAIPACAEHQRQCGPAYAGAPRAAVCQAIRRVGIVQQDRRAVFGASPPLAAAQRRRTDALMQQRPVGLNASGDGQRRRAHALAAWNSPISGRSTS